MDKLKKLGPEKLWENEIKHELKKRGAWWIKYWGGGVYTRKGVPDLLVCYKGRFIAIEVKSDTGEISDAQRSEMAKIEEFGGIGVFSRPNNKNALWSVFDALDAKLEPPRHTEVAKLPKTKKKKGESLPSPNNELF